jgi:small subunit ribosomal protein S20
LRRQGFYPKKREKFKKTVDFLKIQWYNTYLHRVSVHHFTIRSEEVFGLPNIKSAKKRVLVNQAKAMQNKAAKSALKTDIKKFEAAVAEGNRSEADVAYKVAVKAVDKAAAKGLLHKNNAANKKSSLTLKLNKLA